MADPAVATIRVAGRADIEVAAATLTRALARYPLSVAVYPDLAKRMRWQPRLLTELVTFAVNDPDGCVDMTDDGCAVAVWTLLGGGKQTGLAQALEAVAGPGVGRLREAVGAVLDWHRTP